VSETDWLTSIRTITERGGVRIPIAEGFLFTNLSRGQFLLEDNVVYWVENGSRYVPDLSHPEWPLPAPAPDDAEGKA
jgi:hypothetical protein